MQKFKNLLYYGWWTLFWVAVLVGAVWFLIETKTFRFFAPFLFLSFVIYAVYAMFKTKPELPEFPTPTAPPPMPPTESQFFNTEENLTPDTKSEAKQ